MTRSMTMAEPSLVTKDKVIEYLRAFGLAGQLNPQETAQFVNIAQEYQLNPFKREIHCVPYGDGEYRKLSIIVGYEVYIKRAERTGKLDGWKAWTEGQGDLLKAVVEIHRKDWHSPFTHEVYWREAVQKKKDGSPTTFWSKMPQFQLKKVAISQAFRLAFPDELGGLPYDPSELTIPESTMPPEPRQTAPEPAITVPVVEVVPNEPEPTELPEFLALEDYLREHEDGFEPKHLRWIRQQVESNPTPETAQKMHRYAQKFVKNRHLVATGQAQNLDRLARLTRAPIYARS